MHFPGIQDDTIRGLAIHNNLGIILHGLHEDLVTTCQESFDCYVFRAKDIYRNQLIPTQIKTGCVTGSSVSRSRHISPSASQ